jgi:hypothetical protein
MYYVKVNSNTVNAARMKLLAAYHRGNHDAEYDRYAGLVKTFKGLVESNCSKGYAGWTKTTITIPFQSGDWRIENYEGGKK